MRGGFHEKSWEQCIGQWDKTLYMLCLMSLTWTVLTWPEEIWDLLSTVAISWVGVLFIFREYNFSRSWAFICLTYVSSTSIIIWIILMLLRAVVWNYENKLKFSYYQWIRLSLNVPICVFWYSKSKFPSKNTSTNITNSYIILPNVCYALNRRFHPGWICQFLWKHAST